MAAELAAVMIGTSDKAVRDWSLNSLRMIARSAREQVRQVPVYRCHRESGTPENLAPPCHNP